MMSDIDRKILYNDLPLLPPTIVEDFERKMTKNTAFNP